jgi:hypothetical protein
MARKNRSGVAEAQEVSLADELCAVEKAPRRRWADELPPDLREELDKVRERLRSGECKRSYLSMAKAIKAKLGVSVQPLAITQWLKSKD